MFAALARFTVRFRWPVLVLFLILFPVAGIAGGGVFASLKPGGFDDPTAESTHARDQLFRELGAGSADLIALYTAPSGTVDDDGVRAAVTASLDRVAQDPAVQQVTGYYNTGAPQFVSKDRARTFAVLTLRGDDKAKEEAAAHLEPLLRAEGIETRFGGVVPISKGISTTIEKDLRRAELIAFPLTAVLLVIVFGSLVAAGVPLLLGGFAILLAFATLRIIAAVTDVSIFASNVVTVMGLGLAIDYSLFILNRYREELPARGVEGALVTTLSTTGRAVAFSGVTIAASLVGLFAFPQMFLRSMAMGGIAVTLGAVLISLTLLPAFIAVLGSRIDAVRLPWLRRSGEPAAESGLWHRLAFGVMRRPVAVAAAVVVLLLVLGAPFLRVTPSTPDYRVLSPSYEARQVSDVLDAQFLPHETTPHEVSLTVRGEVLSPENIGSLYDYVQRVAAVPDVARVDSVFSLVPGLSREQYQALYSVPAAQQDPALAAGLSAFARGSHTRLSVISRHDIDAPEAQRQVEALRALPPPTGMSALVGGAAAGLHDLKSAIRDRGPLMLAVIGVVMFVVLFLVFGSVTLPLKAMVMNLLSLTASFGALVWVFQDGRFENVLRYQSLSSVDATNPILMFAIVFGLSMDYEVLLLSRVREEYLRTGDNTQAVARGLEKTGRLITSAALLLIVVVGAFATSSIVFMKQLGAGMALAVALDATVVRALLVPAAMRLMGRWNWWSPAPLTWLWRRVGLGDLEGHGASAAVGD
jgi:uncharacterized membrane protein YdfJ with MMPL/SSD domain